MGALVVQCNTLQPRDRGSNAIKGCESITDMPSLKYISLVLMMLQNAVTPIVFRWATTQSSAATKFDTSVAFTTQEFIKLIASLLLYFHEVGFSPSQCTGGIWLEFVGRPKDTAKLAVPAGLYFLQNSALQIASANLPAAVFQVLYQGKTLVVAICSVLLLRKVLSKAKWLSLLLMALGLASVQLGSGEESKQKQMGNNKEQSIQLGLMVVALGCFCSGFAGVYFESMMKPQAAPDGTPPKNPSMWIRNAQLAAFSLLIGWSQIVMSGTSARLNGDLFHGFTPEVWMMVLNNALGGLLVAFCIKHADNILKGFACALATVVSTFASVPLFGYEIGPMFVLGVGVVLYSTLLYGGTLKLPVQDPESWDQEFQICAVYEDTKDTTISLDNQESICKDGESINLLSAESDAAAVSEACNEGSIKAL